MAELRKLHLFIIILCNIFVFFLKFFRLNFVLVTMITTMAKQWQNSIKAFFLVGLLSVPYLLVLNNKENLVYLVCLFSPTVKFVKIQLHAKLSHAIKGFFELFSLLIMVSSHHLHWGVSVHLQAIPEPIIFWKHQFALINPNIFMKRIG